MAINVLKGDARFEFTPLGGLLTTHLLGMPLQELDVMDTVTKFEWWSASLRTRELITIGDSGVQGARELLATIRADDDPAGLKIMIREALHNGVTLTYRKTSAGVAFPLVLLGSAARVVPDRDLFSQGRYEARVHMRRIDGGNLDGLWHS